MLKMKLFECGVPQESISLEEWDEYVGILRQIEVEINKTSNSFYLFKAKNI